MTQNTYSFDNNLGKKMYKENCMFLALSLSKFKSLANILLNHFTSHSKIK
jgi:hypothetical protein